MAGPEPRRHVRAVDATVIKEPARPVLSARALQPPAARVGFVILPDHGQRGQQTGEHLRRFPLLRGYHLSDRGYSNPPGVAAVHGQGADSLCE